MRSKENITPQKFLIHPDESSDAIEVYDETEQKLFAVGYETIRVMKKDSTLKCSVKEVSFIFDGHKILSRPENVDHFEVNRIIVLQLE